MKTALITGGSRGIGAAIGRALAGDGFRVIVNYLNSQTAAETLARSLGGAAVRADVSDAKAVLRMFDAIGGVDALICNAGISLSGLLTDGTEGQFRRVLDVNLMGVVNCCQAAIPRMVSKRSGRIITVSSVWGITGASCEAVYSAAKAAVIGLTKSLAKELGPSGVTVNCLAPGVIETDMNASLPGAALDALREQTPLGRLGTPEDVAAVARFLASDAAGFITGQVISPNGGIVI